MKVYIAGPMSGLPLFNFPAFFEMEEQLRSQGFEVVNPARFGVTAADAEGAALEAADQALPWEACLRRDIPELLKCDAIYLLEGWSLSRGARLEHYIASALGHRLLGHTEEESWA